MKVPLFQTHRAKQGKTCKQNDSAMDREDGVIASGVGPQGDRDGADGGGALTGALSCRHASRVGFVHETRRVSVSGREWSNWP